MLDHKKEMKDDHSFNILFNGTLNSLCKMKHNIINDEKCTIQ